MATSWICGREISASTIYTIFLSMYPTIQIVDTKLSRNGHCVPKKTFQEIYINTTATQMIIWHGIVKGRLNSYTATFVFLKEFLSGPPSSATFCFRDCLSDPSRNLHFYMVFMGGTTDEVDRKECFYGQEDRNWVFTFIWAYEIIFLHQLPVYYQIQFSQTLTMITNASTKRILIF